MWIKTLYDEIVNTDYIHVIYNSPVDYKHNTFDDKWAVRAVVGGENRNITLYECENEQESKDKLNEIMNKLNNSMNVRGHWVKVGDSSFKCSNCKEVSCCQANYCPDCGMKMEYVASLYDNVF